jgi:hypothetical protein
MQRWVLVRDGIVRCYLLSENEPDEAARRALVFGDAEIDPPPPLEPEGRWLRVPVEAGMVGDGWRCGPEGQFAMPAEAEWLPRTVSGAEFLALFTAAEVASMWQSGPEFMVAALRIAAQNEVNLNSPDLARLLRLAVARGALPGARLPRITAGLSPV